MVNTYITGLLATTLSQGIEYSFRKLMNLEKNIGSPPHNGLACNTIMKGPIIVILKLINSENSHHPTELRATVYSN